MEWKKKVICRILLLVAEMFADDLELRKRISDLSTHICYGTDKGLL